MLGGYANALVQELGGEVRSVGPHNCVKLRVKDEGAKVPRVPKWLEDRSLELSSKIDLAPAAVTKAEPQYEVSNVTRFQ